MLDNSHATQERAQRKTDQGQEKGQNIVNHIMQQDMPLSNPPTTRTFYFWRMQHFYQSGSQLRNIASGHDHGQCYDWQD